MDYPSFIDRQERIYTFTVRHPPPAGRTISDGNKKGEKIFKDLLSF